MFVVCVTVKIKPEHVEAFAAATHLNHEGSVREPGCVRFDVLQSTEDSCHFILYEVYNSQDDFDAHKETAHFARWRETVEPLMSEPRTRVYCRSLDPDPWK